MQTFKNKLVAIVGLSVEGLDSVKFFHGEGAKIWCCDRRIKEELGKTYTELAPITAGFQLGADYLKNLDRFDYIVRTPGMNPRIPQFQGREITSSTKLFFLLCTAPIIGVTGTKGKGTTSTLIAKMLESDGKKVTGVAHVPGGKGPFPVIVMFRGYVDSDKYFPQDYPLILILPCLP